MFAYSAGQPEVRLNQKPTKQAYLLPGDSSGVLCIHGFTGTPFEMEKLAESLHNDGRTVRVMLLPGHGTHPDDLNATYWRHWTEAVADELADLSNQCDQIAIVGQSLGGLLGLFASIEHRERVAAVASLAAPLWLTPLPTGFVSALQTVPFLKRLIPSLPKVDGSDVRCPEMKAANPSYSVIPTAALVQLSLFMKEVRANLDRVSAPLHIVHSKQDHTAPFGSAAEIQRRVASEFVQLQTLSESYHLVSFDIEHEIVIDGVRQFFAEVLGWNKKAGS